MSPAELPIESLHLHPTATKSLRRRGIATLGDLTQRTSSELRERSGPATVEAIQRLLAGHGLALREGRKPPERRRRAPATPASPATLAGKAAADLLATAQRGATWARARIGSALIRIGERLAD